VEAHTSALQLQKLISQVENEQVRGKLEKLMQDIRKNGKNSTLDAVKSVLKQIEGYTCAADVLIKIPELFGKLLTVLGVVS